MELQKFAAIDIGTNAVRLLFMNIIEDGNLVQFKKSSLIRMPLRLGDHVFEHGEIREPKITQMIQTMHAFKLLIDANQTVAYRACATSAMRESKNAKQIVAQIKKVCDLDIEIISGKAEAEMLYKAHLERLIQANKAYLYIDVGGGSTEISVFKNKEITRSYSFNIGTIRLLNGWVTDDDMQHMKRWVQLATQNLQEIEVIGSGGNINKIFKLLHKKEGQPITLEELRSKYDELKSYTYDERVSILGLNPDRADVIIPATKIFLKIMKWANATQVLVPKVGLSDGIIKSLYFKYKASFYE